MRNHADMERWELLAQVSQAYRCLFDAFMDKIGLHRAQSAVLCRLYAQDGMTQSEIASELAVQGATITNMLQRMEETGLVRRCRDEADNRVVRVYLTELGREKKRALITQLEAFEEAIFADISPADDEVLRGLLCQILHNMSVKQC